MDYCCMGIVKKYYSNKLFIIGCCLAHLSLNRRSAPKIHITYSPILHLIMILLDLYLCVWYSEFGPKFIDIQIQLLTPQK